MSKSAIVVGAGPGGLATAMLLAAGGMKVKIVERLGHVGGRTSSLEAEGFRFDLGPTFFLYPRVLERIFAAVGRDLHEEVEMVRLDPQYRVAFGSGGHLDATADEVEMERQICALAPGDAGGFQRFMTENRRKLEEFAPCLESPFLGWRDVLNHRMARLLPLLRPHEMLDGSLRRFFRDPRIRLAFCFQSKYLGMSPFRCPSLFSILSFLEYEHGVWHPMGGCGEVTRAMARVAEEIGVEIALDEPVEEILFRGRRATGVRTPSGVCEADAVVINADFAQAMTHLVPDRLRRRWSDRKLKKKKYSCSTFMMYLGIEGRYELPHHSIYISENYERNLHEIEHQHVLSDDPSFYVQNASVTDSSLAPKGMSTLYLLAPVSHQHENIDWSRERDRFRHLLLQQVGKIGYTDLEKRIRFERVLTPANWEHDHQIYRGATFNLAHTLGQMLHLRPRNRFEDVDGVYLTGGGTHPGSGLPVIFESARITSRLLLQDLGLHLPEGGGDTGQSDPGGMSTPATRILAAREAQQAWADVSVRDRLRRMREVRRLIARDGAKLAEAANAHRPRPLVERLTAEVIPLAAAVQFLERKAGRALRTRKLGRRGRPLWLAGVKAEIWREAYGVVLVVGPANYPLFLPAVQTLQALVAGNTVLLKPGRGGAAAAQALAAICEEAGLPAALLQVLPEDPEEVYAALEAGVDLVVFTGSSENGRQVLRAAAEKLVPVIAELSGEDPALVRADADVPLVGKALRFGSKLNGGESCIAPRRLLVPMSLAASLAQQNHGLPLTKVADDEAALAAANSSPLALGATIFSRDEAAARALARRVHAGVVVINDCLLPTADPRLPFGGRQGSGYGVTRGLEGLLALTRPKVICFQRGRRRHLEPAHPGDESFFLAYLQAAHGRPWRERCQWILRLLRLASQRGS